MTGRPGYRTMEMNGGSSASYLARTPCVPLFCTLFNVVGNRRAFRLPGEGGDHFHCTVEPSPGHIRCQKTKRAQNDHCGIFNLFRIWTPSPGCFFLYLFRVLSPRCKDFVLCTRPAGLQTLWLERPNLPGLKGCQAARFNS